MVSESRWAAARFLDLGQSPGKSNCWPDGRRFRLARSGPPYSTPSSLANADLAGRFYLASRGVPDYLMTLVRGAAAEALQRGNEQIEMDDLARIFERCLAQQRVLGEQSNPFIGDLDKAALDRAQAADQTRTAGVGLSPRASGAKRRPAKAIDYLGGRQ